MTDVQEVLRLAQQQLSQAGLDSPQAEAAIIVAHVLDITRGRLGVLQALGERLDDDDVAAITELVNARARRIPLQYLTGTTGFYGLDLKIVPGVFIPRVETEVLVETTLQHFAKQSGPLNILELCTGSGAIAAALADQLDQREIPVELWAVDISPEAVQLAETNTSGHDVTVLCADATDTASIVDAEPLLERMLGSFDAVVSNPPYIPTTTPVTQHEAEQDPHLALYGGSPDGTAIPRRIAEQAAQWLAPHGFFMMEHDHSHADDLAAMLSAHSAWNSVTTIKDLTGTDRFVTAIRTPPAKPTPKPSPTLAQ